MCWTVLFPWFLPKGLMCCTAYYVGCFLCCFFFNSGVLWNPFSECQSLGQFPDLMSQPEPGWAQRWMICHLGTGPCSSQNGFRRWGHTIDKAPSQGYEAVFREHIWIPSRGSCQKPGGEGRRYLEQGLAVKEISFSRPELSIKDLEVLNMKAHRGNKPCMTTFRADRYN